MSEAGDGAVDKKSEGGQKVQNFSYEITKSWGCNVQHSDYGLQYCVVYLEVGKRVDLKRSQKKEFILEFSPCQ